MGVDFQQIRGCCWGILESHMTIVVIGLVHEAGMGQYITYGVPLDSVGYNFSPTSNNIYS